MIKITPGSLVTFTGRDRPPIRWVTTHVDVDDDGLERITVIDIDHAVDDAITRLLDDGDR